jgi:hypothetical protein
VIQASPGGVVWCGVVDVQTPLRHILVVRRPTLKSQAEMYKTIEFTAAAGQVVA